MLKCQLTELYGGVVSIRVSNSEGMRFEFLGGYRLPVVRFYDVSYRPKSLNAAEKKLSLYLTK
jgi:hypothetical protein